VVSSLDAREQALLLRFVTSCQRPPPLGFEHLNPPFTIQRIPIAGDFASQRIPIECSPIRAPETLLCFDNNLNFLRMS
jgi:hypothetical protein